ncbi:tyrosine-type recombinase/integrase [Serratia marcescens]|uniref:tyrosine-type recombinase/integrase n=1 Tax=Serratia marcescens TaxID=615 RepID=UPI000760277C|nr:site-specific integrase [Serratia marcescens]MBN3902802.1 tyrosine-type recombinase/integrase [Serratia marcescens]MBN3912152.1 tyrosine-type recombinase/integrase [Serratia marcescens]MBN3916950.1 tyrosine-type recombinase/integrase [Serratia marcescens]MBN3935427.1 tyrosine-type recombinase/integrase [Serratia marcescens]MBN3952657.1 tyrosine-type recombinase/integrase [Serratia marcescens]
MYTVLTDAKLRKLNGKPIPKLIEMPDGGGLSIRITPLGLIVFQYRYRYAGKARRMTLGSYDEISLKEARDMVQEAKRVLAEGKDPITVKSMTLEEIAGAASVKDCLSYWTASAQAQRLVKLQYWERAFERHVIPYVGDMIVDEMQISHWQPVFKRMRTNGAETFAGIMLSKLKQVFSYCLRTEKIRVNPIAALRISDVGKPVGVVKRYFSDDEIGAFWLALEGSRIVHQNKIFIKLLLLTGCRGVELRKAKKGEFDVKNRTWRVPAENSKTRQPFVRGLSGDAAKLIEEAMSLYPNISQLFPPAIVQGDRPMSAGVLLNMAGQLRNEMGVHDWAMHDLRRTAKTKMSELGIEPHVSEKVLGHKLGGVLAVYDQHSYLKEQQNALDIWAAHVASCVSSMRP